MSRICRISLLLLAVSALCHIARGGTIYNVTLNTSPLVGHPAGPFYLMVVLTSGGDLGTASDTVALSHTSLGGGSSSGSPLLYGGVTGSLESGVAIVDSQFLNVFSEQFVPGTQLSFTLRLASNDGTADVPGGVMIFILDNSGLPIPTLASPGNYILGAGLRPTSPPLQVYASDPSRAPSVGGPISMGAPVVQLISKQTKADAWAALQTLLPSGRQEVDREIREAIQLVKSSVATELWSDDYRLTKRGNFVFGEELAAVHELDEVERLSPALTTQIGGVESALALVDRSLAQTAIDDANALGSKGKRLTKAQEEVACGDDFASRGDYDAAIEHYWAGWILVEAP